MSTLEKTTSRARSPARKRTAEVALNHYVGMAYIRSPLRRNNFTRNPSFLRK